LKIEVIVNKSNKDKGHQSKKKCRYPAPKPTRKRIGDRVNEDDIVLKIGTGSLKSGGMPGGFFWHIYYKDEKAGKIYINYDISSNRAEIQIFINQKSQGKGIGRVAYKRACELSQYSEIYATMRKSNTASLKAAFAAGFRAIPSDSNQVQMLWSKLSFSIEAFERLPEKLPRSSYVDFLLLLGNLKPALRIKISQNENIVDLSHWCETNDFYFLLGKDDYAFIAKNKTIANNIEIIDISTSPHEYELGKMLGYPDCCCKKIAKICEENIDKYEDVFINEFNVKNSYVLINPKGYKEGYALISHIPCSPTCEYSLRIAQKSFYIISRYNDRESFKIWVNAWKEYFFLDY